MNPPDRARAAITTKDGAPECAVLESKDRKCDYGQGCR